MYTWGSKVRAVNNMLIVVKDRLAICVLYAVLWVQEHCLSPPLCPLLASPPPCESVLRVFCHLVVFCPYFISTCLLLTICCSRKTLNKPAVSMEITQRDEGGQGLDEDGDDVTADVTTEHAFWAADCVSGYQHLQYFGILVPLLLCWSKVLVFAVSMS